MSRRKKLDRKIVIQTLRDKYDTAAEEFAAAYLRLIQFDEATADDELESKKVFERIVRKKVNEGKNVDYLKQFLNKE